MAHIRNKNINYAPYFHVIHVERQRFTAIHCRILNKYNHGRLQRVYPSLESKHIRSRR